jgi:hypothetical protein
LRRGQRQHRAPRRLFEYRLALINGTQDPPLKRLIGHHVDDGIVRLIEADGNAFIATHDRAEEL